MTSCLDSQERLGIGSRLTSTRDMAQSMKGCLYKCEGLGFDYNKTGLGAMSITLALGW